MEKIARFNANLLLVHTRHASQGIGTPSINKNNHPFTSTDHTLGFIHNGRIPEYEALKQRFQVLTECDSEILLRIIEADDCRLQGIKDIFSMSHQGHLAAALGEKLGCQRHLWLFRNWHRTLWIVDLREKLGQVFFCSTADIWQAAVPDSGEKLTLLPCEEVWFFDLHEVKKYPLEMIPVQQKPVQGQIITGLDSEEEPLVYRGFWQRVISFIRKMFGVK